ncbi:restriction endonuclease [Comamonas sp. UBA7528]|uniref:restriction endonuclease n=1 Tax=Comamonas sp. UBA7528 TaxID=1946391 RepID=UPI0025C70F3F|nr:restriction endonuclease [Comamonas sp. UBA7528]
MSKKMDPSWKTYEEIAALVLNQCATDFGIERVEGKQKVVAKSGTTFEVDARAWTEGDTAHLLVECKEHKNTRINQAITSALAWQIFDTDAKGGFLVSPNGLQSGARSVAKAANIHEIKLNPASTASAWFGEWLGKLRAGFTDEVNIGVSEHLEIMEIDQQGKTTVVYDSAKGDSSKF